jgi:hypothetical protein
MRFSTCILDMDSEESATARAAMRLGRILGVFGSILGVFAKANGEVLF